jgi:hypothetical protein
MELQNEPNVAGLSRLRFSKTQPIWLFAFTISSVKTVAVPARPLTTPPTQEALVVCNAPACPSRLSRDWKPGLARECQMKRAGSCSAQLR